jgi:hypothetical protein
VHHAEPEAVDLVDVGAVALQQEGELVVAFEDCVVKAAEPLEVFEVYPAGFALLVVLYGIFFGSLVIDFQEFFDNLVIIVLAGDVQDCIGLRIDDIAEWDGWVVIEEPLHLPGFVSFYYGEEILLFTHFGF